MIRRRRHSEQECLAAFDPPIAVIRPVYAAGPLVLSSPHSGRIYPKAFIDQSDLPLHILRQNEDAFIDEMLGFAHHLDIPLISALFPRCFVDVNRDASEIPVHWQGPGTVPSSARAEMGLGVIPTIIADKSPIYRKAIKPHQVLPRLDALYHPYHAALMELVGAALSQFGSALLLDVHSMPGFTQMGQRRPDIVLGDRHGTSCHPETMARMDQLFTERGYEVARNHPYAGGFVTAHYGRPAENMEVIQIEINRDLYLNPVTYARKTGYARLTADLKSICFELLPIRREIPLAAE
ncbi:MAG: N-formylglutamate amidohydrolase [Hellea sp.]|nr:N-formylglutamate amidohydrolase [Hellea sp.]